MRKAGSITRRRFLAAAGTAASAPLLIRAQTKPGNNKAGLPPAFIDRLPALLEWANVPGLAVSIMKDGRPAWSQGFGVRKAGEEAPVTTDTLFGAASLSKPVFAYAILRMRDEKLIDLDRPLWNYLPYEDLPPVENSKTITARHVLSHSSGLQNWRFNRDNKLELAFKPGERFQYSGEGFYYLQRVLEHITGRGFEEYMRERVLKPLGMVNSTFAWTPAAEQKMSWGHNSRSQPVEAFNALRGKRHMELAAEWKRPLAGWKHEDAVRANAAINKDSPGFPNSLLPNTAGSLITSVDEYALFMSRLLGRRREGADLLDASRREMLSPQTKINNAVSWGVGVGLEDYGGRQMFWHWGDNGVFKAFMMGDPQAGNGVVVFTNAQNGHKMWRRVVAEAMGDDHPAFYFYMT